MCGRPGRSTSGPRPNGSPPRGLQTIRPGRCRPVEAIPAGVTSAVLAAANTPYEDDGPLVRIAVAPGPPAEVVVAGHHAVLDGLGLVAVAGAVLGVELGTKARGVAATARAGAVGRLAYPLRRVGEAVFRPPARIAQRSGPASEGDHLVATAVDAAVTTPGLVAAAARAVQVWNARSGAASSRVAVAVGASARPGDAARIGRDAAWFRIVVPPDATEARVRELLEARGPEPPAAPSALRAARATGLAARLERRTGSTLLVSNLGLLRPGDAVAEAAFYPSAHGRSGLAVGGVRTGRRTTLTVRARRAGFSEEEARRFLDLVAGDVAAAGGPGAR